jgi:hypothetical protein
MRYVISTRQNLDSTYDSTGTRTRRIFKLKTERGVVNRLIKKHEATGGEKYRLQWWSTLQDGAPYATTFVIIGKDAPYRAKMWFSNPEENND